MSGECGAQVFFPGLSQRFSGLFEGDAPVWTGLDRLKSFIRQNITPNLPDAIRAGVPVETAVVLLPGGWATEGFELVCNDDTKGRMQVWLEGEHVPEATLICPGAVFADKRVELGRGVLIEPDAFIKGPAIIGDNTEVRQGAYVRGDVLVGAGCVVGHATEVKHAVFLDGAKAGHFAYVGDSILGNDVNLGAGTKFANLKFAPGTVSISLPDGSRVDTGRRKMGAILGDGCQTGCNSVTNPGVLLGPGSLVAPNATVAPGLYGPRTIIR
jgi:bifunctional N-acetylglucosamine-1-phosphate-uridyltransferase/glucosamine-1-phosphate-acetyltransferase GlmU-like protein